MQLNSKNPSLFILIPDDLNGSPNLGAIYHVNWFSQLDRLSEFESAFLMSTDNDERNQNYIFKSLYQKLFAFCMLMLYQNKMALARKLIHFEFFNKLDDY